MYLSLLCCLNPVGAGASGLRTKTANELVRDIKFTVIRGNISEIRTLMEGTGNTKGVDADLADAVTEENLDETIGKLKAFSEATGSVIAVTGAIDLVADSEKCYVIRNGKPEMGAITRNWMPAFWNDDGFPLCKRRAAFGGSSGGSLCDGNCRRDWI